VGHTTPVPAIRYLVVAGPSMEPTLSDGDWVLARATARISPGHLVVVEHPQRPGLLLVKRVDRVGPDGYWVLGDAPSASTDSRHFGPVAEVLGRVVWRVRPWGRVR
jgi:nickel-type superoxide dismutase maturation protease